MDEFLNFCNTGIPPVYLYYSLLISGVIIVSGFLTRRVIDKKRFIYTILLFEYLFVVIGSTVLFRGAFISSFERIQLTPFWTYDAIGNHTPGVSVWDILLNIVLFVPLGFFMSLVFPSLKMWKIVLIGSFFSVCIESLQYIFVKGVAQIDDVMHNILGCYLGTLMPKMTVGCKRERLQ